MHDFDGDPSCELTSRPGQRQAPQVRLCYIAQQRNSGTEVSNDIDQKSRSFYQKSEGLDVHKSRCQEYSRIIDGHFQGLKK